MKHTAQDFSKTPETGGAPSDSTIAIVVLDGFSTLSLGAIVEPLHFFREKFPSIAPRFLLVGGQEKEVRSQSGVAFSCDETLADFSNRLSGRNGVSAICFCCDSYQRLDESSDILSLLRRSKRSGVALYGIGRASWIFAEMGLLDGHKATTHWSSLVAFSESFSDVSARNVLFVSNGLTTTCAGELAALDMIIHSIAKISRKAAQYVCDQLLISYPRVSLST